MELFFQSSNEFVLYFRRSEEIPEENDEDDSDLSMKVKRRKLSEYPEILEKQYKEYIPYRDGVIQKWNDRTKIASGKFAKSNFSAFDQPILKQIEQIMSEKHRLIQKTYMKRSQYDIIGEEPKETQVIFFFFHFIRFCLCTILLIPLLSGRNRFEEK